MSALHRGRLTADGEDQSNDSNRIEKPRAGFYTMRLAKRALPVAVRIWWGEPVIDDEVQQRSPRWCVEVDGETTRDGELLDVFDVWPFCCGTPTTERDYHFLLRRKHWAVAHDPAHPAANPRRSIDIRNLKPGW